MGKEPSWNDVKNGQGNFDYLFENETLDDCVYQKVEEPSQVENKKQFEPIMEEPIYIIEENTECLDCVSPTQRKDNLKIKSESSFAIFVYLILYVLCVVLLDRLSFFGIEISSLLILVAGYRLECKRGLILSLACVFFKILYRNLYVNSWGISKL